MFPSYQYINHFQEECWWDCQTNFGEHITNFGCLADCFANSGGSGLSNSTCFDLLIKDVTTNGTCDDTVNAELGWSDLTNNCIRDDSNDITKGTCSNLTEDLLQTAPCKRSFTEQPGVIKWTLEAVVRFSCRTNVYDSLHQRLFSQTRKGKQAAEEENRATTRLPPIAFVDSAAGTKTELNYTHTLHRYPWICSLRTKGITAEQLCAVTLISLPPQPTIIVGPAHCTNLCLLVDTWTSWLQRRRLEVRRPTNTCLDGS